jgi:ankyrin repeat protein
MNSDFQALIKPTLIDAVYYERYDVLRSLLEASADLNVTNKHGQTALHYAACRNNVYALKSLILAGSALDVRDNAGYTALIHAGHQGNFYALNVLAQAGADLDVTNARGTALHCAAWKGNVNALKVLITAGAGLDVRDCKDRTALDISSKMGTTDCVHVLTSPALRRENVLARTARFNILVCDIDDTAWLATESLYESLLERVISCVDDRTSFAELRLVCKAWRRAADASLTARPLTFFEY